MRLIKFFLIGACLLLAVGYVVEILDFSEPLLNFPASVKLFVYGGLTFLAVWIVFRQRVYAFSVFEHEVTHVLVAKLFLLKTLKFEVSPRKHVEGQVVVGVQGHGPITSVMSVFFSLGPYYIPTLTLLVFAISPLLSDRIRPLFFFLLGFTAVYHGLTTVWEFGFHQADIQQHGEYFSTIFVLLGNIIFLGITLVVVLYGFRPIPAFLISGVLNVFGG